MTFKPLIAGLACALVLSAPAPAMAQAEDADASTVLATVNGVDITLGHVIALVDRLPAQYQGIPDGQLFEGVLDQMIRQSALAQTVDDASVQVRLGVDNEARALKATVALEALEDDVSEEAIDAAMADVPTELNFLASHILVETEELAKDLIAQLQGGADFVALAQEHSTGPSGANGGDLGWFGPGAMVPPFDAAVQAMTPGDISAEPVQTQFGYHVIQLNAAEQRPTVPREEIREQLAASAIEEGIDSVMEKAEVVRKDQNLDPALIRRTDLIGD